MDLEMKHVISKKIFHAVGDACGEIQVGSLNKREVIKRAYLTTGWQCDTHLSTTITNNNNLPIPPPFQSN